MKASPIANFLFRKAKKEDIKTTRRRTSTAAQVIGALCREFILFSDEPAKKSLNLKTSELKEHIGTAALAVLIGPSVFDSWRPSINGVI
jgi:hypothetical protein